MIRRLLLCFFSFFAFSLLHAQVNDSIPADTVHQFIVASPKPAIDTASIELNLPPAWIRSVSHDIEISAEQTVPGEDYTITVNGEERNIQFVQGHSSITFTPEEEGSLEIVIEGRSFSSEVNPIPLWMSIIPPLLAIAMALIFREVLSALFAGIFSGALIIAVYNNGFSGIISGFFAVIDTYILPALIDPDHMPIIMFSMLIGAMVAIISRNGGMKGVVNWLSKYANNARSGQIVTWILGVAIFFDDYANTLIVGNTMRPVTDRLRVSREKLAYLVDSTAAPVAAIAFVTTWIGAELGYIKDGISELGVENFPSPYSIFISSLQYSYYPILTLIFMFMLIWFRKDFGPMYKAETRARETGAVSGQQAKMKDKLGREETQELDDLEPEGNVPLRPVNAIVPVLTVIVGTIIGLFYTGIDADPSVLDDPEMGLTRKLSNIIGNSDSYSALLWSSLSGVVVALILTVSQKIMNLEKTIESMVIGFKTMLSAMLILILAWSLAGVTDHMHTDKFLTQALSIGIAPEWIPAITFILAAAVSFATGSSWGTMAILYPLIIPAAWEVSQGMGFSEPDSMAILHNVVACVLAGSVLGDHCSPISDTTILSSLASSCNHIDHVRTQLPYALTVGSVSILIGTIPAAWGISPLITFPLSLAILFGIIQFFGKRTI